MNLQSAAFTGASALPANGTSQALHSPVAANGRNVFRRVYGLRINTGGLANRIRFDSASAHMSVAFEPDEYDVIGNGASVTAQGSQALLVELPAPMRVTGARFSGIASANTIDLHRLDGDELVEDPTKSFANDSGVSGDFTDFRFGVRLHLTNASLANVTPGNLADLDVKGFPTAARVGITRAGNDPATAFFFWIVPGEVGKDSDSPSGSADIGTMLADAIQQEIDGLEPPYPQLLDFLLVVESDAPCKFTANSFVLPFGLMRASFRGVLLRNDDISDPAALAVHLRDAATPLTEYLRSKLALNTRNLIDRVSGRNVPERTVSLTVKDLNQALQAEPFYSAPRFAGITLTPETLAAATAAPTGVRRTRVNRALLAEAFPQIIAAITEPTDDEKEVLQAQGASSTLDVLVDVPRPAIIRSASVRLEGDLKGDAPANGASGGDGGSTPEWDAPIPDQSALTVDPTRAVARRIQSEAAVDASGLALALATTSLSADLTAELREDQDGTPAGRTIASATVRVDRLDRPEWVHFAFRSPAVVQATPYWIVLRATEGSALWFALEEEAITRTGNAAKGWSDSGGFTSIAPLFHIWSRGANGSAATGNGNADLANRLRVTIGNTTVSPVLGQTGRARTVNIALALQQWINAQPGPAAIAAAPIRVSALGKGSVTVYPPEIEFDL